MNLKLLNRRGKIQERFRMESIYSVRNILPAGVFMATKDLEDAYLHVPIKES